MDHLSGNDAFTKYLVVFSIDAYDGGRLLEKHLAAVDDGINLVTEVIMDLVGTERRSLAAGVGARNVEGAADKLDELSGDLPCRYTNADRGGTVILLSGQYQCEGTRAIAIHESLGHGR